jgi:hypothetical protein
MLAGVWTWAKEFRSVASEVIAMADILLLALTVVFFVLSWLYVRACERI